MVPDELILMVWHKGFESMQPSDTSRFTKAVVVSTMKETIIKRFHCQFYGEWWLQKVPEVTWCGLLFDCLTLASSFEALAYVRQVLPSWSVCFRFALYWKWENIMSNALITESTFLYCAWKICHRMIYWKNYCTRKKFFKDIIEVWKYLIHKNLDSICVEEHK